MFLEDEERASVRWMVFPNGAAVAVEKAGELHDMYIAVHICEQEAA